MDRRFESCHPRYRHRGHGAYVNLLLDQKEKAMMLKKKSDTKTAQGVENADSFLRGGGKICLLLVQEAVVSMRKFVARPLAVK
jgi:hypothetical protein